MNAKVPFAMETVFSHWQQRDDGTYESKIDQIRQMQEAGYFVLLIFVGLASVELSIGRVQTRVQENGHAVPDDRLRQRFPRTQLAISEAIKAADASLLADSSRTSAEAFTLCRVQIEGREVFDLRVGEKSVPSVILRWLDVVSPRAPDAAGYGTIDRCTDFARTSSRTRSEPASACFGSTRWRGASRRSDQAPADRAGPAPAVSPASWRVRAPSRSGRAA